MEKKTVIVMTLTVIAITACLSGCIGISADSNIEAPPGNTIFLLEDRVAQAVFTEFNLVKEITFNFKGCSGQTIKITTEQTYNNIEPKEETHYYDSSYLTLGTGDCALTFTDFGVSYHTNLQYWFQLHLINGDPVEICLSDKNYDGGIAMKNDGSGWTALDKDLAFNIIWLGEEPENPPAEMIELTFASDSSRSADLHRTETSHPNLHSYVFPRQYRVHRVEGTITLNPGYSGSSGFIFAMAYTYTQNLGQFFYNLGIQSGASPTEFDVWIDQDQLESNIVGGVFQTYFGYGYEAHGTVYVTEDCRYWDTACKES